MMTFLRVAALLAAAQLFGAAAMAQDYKIKPGDVLNIEVLEDASLNRQALVLPDGRVTVPLAGTVEVSGLSVDQVRSQITSKLSPNFANDPTVTVSLSSLGTPAPSSGGSGRVSVYLMGEVNTPGLIEVRPGTTLIQAIAVAGGFSRFAALKRVQLRRTDKAGNQQVYTFNYKDVLNGQTSIGATKLASGDVIVVPPRKLFE